mgnify:FL=1
MKHLISFNEDIVNKGEMIYYTTLQDYKGDERQIIENLVDDVQNGYAELVTVYENEEVPIQDLLKSKGINQVIKC